MAAHSSRGKRTKLPHKEPEVTKLEKEDVQWPGKHNSSRSRARQKRRHPNNRHSARKHVNW